MSNRDLVAVGASAGGVEALKSLAAGLPGKFPAAVLVTIHLPSDSRSVLHDILTRSGPLEARFATEGEIVRKSRIYIAPPGRHLLVDGDRLSLGYGARENNCRPAIDPMLRSAAVCCGGRSIGVVLTGTMGDGASGLWAVKQAGGITVVQDPDDAAFPEMPMTALKRSRPDHVVHLAGLPALLDKLAHEPAGEGRPVPATIKYEVEIARSGHANMNDMDRIDRRSVLTCPDCNGVMWEIDEGDLIRYRCHVGHAYAADVMAVALDESLRRALGSALRALEERVALMRKLQKQAHERGSANMEANWAEKAREFEREAQVVRDSIRRMDAMASRFQEAAE